MDASKVIFAKVGWMEFYDGVTDRDPKPEGGGSFTENRVGYEAQNFSRFGDKCFAYSETPSSKFGFNLQRVEPGTSGERLDDVLLVFISKVPGNSPHNVRKMLPGRIGTGYRVVGWFSKCTAYATSHPMPTEFKKLRKGEFNAMCAAADATLIPQTERTKDLIIPKAGGMRANVRYRYTDSGEFDSLPWMENVLEFIKKCEGEITYPDEIQHPNLFLEGAQKQVVVNAYERDSRARQKCVEHYGYGCSVCRFDFFKCYGELGRGYIHVHHLKPLGSIRQEYLVDPIRDLRPVCPNCHAMLHRQGSVISIEELRAMISPCR